MKTFLWRFFFVFLYAATVILPVVWTNSSNHRVAMAQDAKPAIKKIAVMPFFKGRRPDDMDEMINCPLNRLCFNQNDVTSDAGSILTSIVQRTIHRRFDEKSIPSNYVTAAYEKILLESDRKTPSILAKKLGKVLEADYVVIGNFWRYRDHEALIVNNSSGASVAFNIVLFKVESGQKVWKGTFDKTQRPFFDNVLAKDSVRPGFKWLSAKELALMGVRETFKKFPY